jgi:hypothetical protein
MNEPNNMPTPQTWPNAAQAAVNAIRAVDMNTPIVVEGDEWASAQYWMSYNANLKITDPANDIIYSAHSYFDNSSGLYSLSYAQQGDTAQTGVHDVAPYLQWLKTNGYRGFVGELGVPSNDPQWIPLLNNVFNDLQANGVSSTVWNYEMPDSSPAWWASQIESTRSSNLNIAPVKGVVTPQMALIFEHSQPVIESGTAGAATGSLSLSGAAAGGSIVSVFEQGVLLGTTKASVNGSWSFATAPLSVGTHIFTASSTDSSGNVSETSAAYSATVTAAAPPPAAPVISTDSANAAGAVTLTGTAPAGATVTVSDGGATVLGSATASSTGAWSYTTGDLAAGSYAFTATDTTSAGTSAASKAFAVTVAAAPPAAPVISTDSVNAAGAVTLTGTAPAGATVTASDGGATALGSATASSTGAWSYTTGDLAAGSYAFTATDTTSAGTSAASKAFAVTVAAAPAKPVITKITESPASADLGKNKTVTLTLTFSQAVTVAGGTPTLTLNDGGTATYKSGSGTTALTFTYKVGAGQNTPSLAVAAVTLSGATITNSAGAAATLSLTGLTQTGPQINTKTPAAQTTATMSTVTAITPTVTAITASPASGMQYPGDTVAITVKMSEAVTVSGAPALVLNDGGSANYSSGSGTNVLSFKYTVGSTDSNVSTLAAYGVSMPSGTTIKDAAGASANMAGVITSFTGLAVDPPVTAGSLTSEVSDHRGASIVASGRAAESFEFGSGFGHESITALLGNGPSNDILEAPLTMFKGLRSANSAIQNWDGLLPGGAAVQSGANKTISDAAHDILALNNVTTSTLSSHAHAVFKFV